MKFLDENGLQYFWSKLKTLLSNKVDKITGKGLSTEDFTSTEKTKLAGLSNYDDTAISSRVTNLENNIASMPSGKGASGTGSNAEIFNDYTNNTATGDYSHAEGYYTQAIGRSSHAEGQLCIARAGSHAEGIGTVASDSYDFETPNTIGAHAEGVYTEARGMGAHAEGRDTYAYAYDSLKPQHVQGIYNIKDTTGKYAFIIGNGTSEDARHNAFAIDWDGLIYVNGSSTGVDVSTLPTSADVDSKLDSSTVDSSGSSGSSGWYNCRLYNGKIQYYNTDTTYSTTSSVTSGSSALVTSGGVYSALSSKVNSSSLGDAAYKNYTTSATSGSSNLITSGGVYSALADCMQNLGNIGAANLNNYTSESGFFKFSGASNAPNGTTGGGVGIVWHSGTFSGMFVICYDSSTKKETCWARRYNGSTWFSWIQLGTL